MSSCTETYAQGNTSYRHEGTQPSSSSAPPTAPDMYPNHAEFEEAINDVLALETGSTDGSDSMDAALARLLGASDQEAAENTVVDVPAVNHLRGSSSRDPVFSSGGGGGDDDDIEVMTLPDEDASVNYNEVDFYNDSKSIADDMLESRRLLQQFFENKIEPADVLAKEFNTIPMDEQQRIYESVHGVSEVIEETESFVYAKLCDLEVELNQIPHKPGYDAARSRNADYIESQTLRLKFLRAESFDSLRAARRMVAWCDSKLEKVGEGVMGRDLRLSDLRPDAQQVLLSGKFQPLAQPDSSGRPIFYLTKGVFTEATCEGMEQVIHYITGKMALSTEAQKRGVICVHNFGAESAEEVPPETQINMLRSLQMTGMMAGKVQAFHYFGVASEKVQQVAQAFQLSVSKDVRHRFRKHMFSDLQQNLNALSCYGISPNSLPLNNNGELDISSHMRWVMAQQFHEGNGLVPPRSIQPYVSHKMQPPLPSTPKAAQSSECRANAVSIAATSKTSAEDFGDEGTVTTAASSRRSSVSSSMSRNGNDVDDDRIVPTDDDILMGRGRPFLEHPGNKHLRGLVADRSEEYDRVNRSEKYDMAKEIVKQIYARRGRFLKKNAKTGEWEEATWCVAREKVAHAFRKRREMNLAKARKEAKTTSSRNAKRTTLDVVTTTADIDNDDADTARKNKVRQI